MGLSVFLANVFSKTVILSFPKFYRMKYLPVIFLISLFLLGACKSRPQYDIKTSDQYEKGKLSVEEIEKKNPEHFLSVSGSNKKNLLGQTVVRATLFNNAKMMQYKDVEVKLSFYSKTGSLLEEDHETIYESIHPGESKAFKSKYFAPKGTDSVGLKVVTAKF